MQTRIEVGILGATGMVGQHFIKFLQGHPWFDLTWLGASDRSAGKKYKDAMTWHLGGGTPESVAGLTVEECKPGNAPRLLFSAMDASVATEIERAFAAGRPRRRLQFAQSPHGAGRAAARPRNQCRPPQAHPRPAARPRLERADRHQSQLLHHRPHHGARSAEAVRHHTRHRHHHAGHLRRGLSRRRFHGHHGQRHSLHRQRRRKNAAGDAEDPGRIPRRSHRASRRQSQRALQSRPRGRWPHRHRLRRVLLQALARPICATPSKPSAPCRRSAICPARRRARSST